MKIVILNTSERTGGAAVAAGRLGKALEQAGVQVNRLVRDDTWLNCFRFYWERLIIFLCNHLNRKNLFAVSFANTGMDLSGHPLVKDADIIHLHWINQGFLSVSDLGKLIDSGKPIVWTLHDLWPATAICHYPDECEKYQSRCSHCPLQVTNSLFDLANWTYNRKKRIGLDKVHFVGCSKWITEMAKRSSLLEVASFTSIPNPIDTSVFKPLVKKDSRERFQLPKDKLLLLFAAAKLSDRRKGAAHLIEACSILKQYYTDKIEIVLMGNGSEELCQALPFKVNSLGYISDISTMVAVYSCADLFVIPSLEDNLPNTIMESMACGTPCVGFEIGGIPEMIDHRVNGYVASYKDASDLANGIQWVLEHEDRLALSDACVKKVQENYAEEVVAGQYTALYTKLLRVELNSYE
ncbi:glycosyltransferase family 4 protein [uncultured Parabacteroides sp.]|uniref:glycosyltransferase family 4 protein n=1 Tax=uncultured Parabacteroides sp. TaxID=512312 RepID=UPI0025CBC2D4|nr:glycosyltransferase family 4 protein [uncultured Parabacteroides sp.]